MEQPIFLCTLDAIRRDWFTNKNFPETYKYLNDFATFTDAWSHGTATPLAFPHLLTGSPPLQDGTLDPDHATIAERIPHTDTVGFGNNPHLTVEKGYGRGLSNYHEKSPPSGTSAGDFLYRIKYYAKQLPGREYLYQIYSGVQQFTPENVFTDPGYRRAERVSAFVNHQFSTAPNSFVWAHYMDAHFPFDHNGVLGTLNDVPESEVIDEQMDMFRKEEDPYDIELIDQLYKLNIEYLDHHLASLFSSLKDQNQYEDLMIILTSDHGELFDEYGRTTHPKDMVPPNELLQVPLFVKLPDNNRCGEELTHRVSHSDIPVTIESELSNTPPQNDDTTLWDTDPRDIVAYSNTAIRLITDSGEYVRKRTGETSETGTLDKDAKKRVDHLDFLEMAEVDGTIQGVEEADRKRRLKNLGYR